MLFAVVFAATAGGAPAGTSLSYAELPDPLDQGPYGLVTTDPLVVGETTFEEPSSSGGAPTGANETITVPVRGVMYQPATKPGKSPLILLVHGNHGECDGKVKSVEVGPVGEKETIKEEEQVQARLRDRRRPTNGTMRATRTSARTSPDGATPWSRSTRTN